MFSQFETHLKKLQENLDPLLETTKVVKDGLITMRTPLKNLKLGKYKLVKDAPAVTVPYDKAVEKGYIGTATLENIKEFEDIGFVFDKVVFKGIILPDDLTPPPWWNSVYGPWVPRRPKPVISSKVGTIVLGTDPKGGPVAYVRSAGMDAPKLYTPTEYSNVAVAYRKYATGTTEVPPEELAGRTQSSMSVARVAKDPTVEDILKDAVKSTKKKKWTIHPDGTIDIHGEFKLSNRFTLNAVRKIDFRGKFPIKLGVVEGNFNAYDFNDLTGAPKVVKGSLVITTQDVPNAGIGPAVNITALKDTIVEGEEIHISLNGSVLDTASVPAAKKISLHRATIKADAFKDLRLLQPGKLVLSNCIIENFIGLPDPFQGELEITEYAAKQRLSLEGLPKRIEGDFDLTSYNSDSGANPVLSSETFPDFITGDLKLIMKNVTERDLLKMYIGDRVGGPITALVDNQRVVLDKSKFTKAYIDALTQHTSTHGVNLADL